MGNAMTQGVPGALQAGTQVGHWRVVEVLGKGAYGTVYSAERVGPGETGLFALKMASSPDDPRFEREVELLSRIRHPRIPQLHDWGWWVHPSGVAFPYLVMDRIEGRPLYEWASECNPSGQQMMRVLADLAWALDATHRVNCVHRDIKGENVLVSAEGRAFLMDFGAGDFKGARTLTRDLLPPGTPHYRSPQALRFQWAHRHEPGAHYEPGPADDVYALGVTAYILVTGACPPCGVDLRWEAEPASVPPPAPLPPPSTLAAVSPELDALIMRMLSDAPEARGHAREIAHALERDMDTKGLKAGVPRTSRQSEPAPSMNPSGLLGGGRPMKALIGAAAMTGIVFGISVWWNRGAPEVRYVDSEDEGTVALGDTGSPLTNIASPHRAPTMGLGLDLPKEPLPGQQLPPCREGFEVEIELTGGKRDTRSCWIKVDANAAKCKVNGYEYKGGCYLPMYPPVKSPPSTRQ